MKMNRNYGMKQILHERDLNTCYRKNLWNTLDNWLYFKTNNIIIKFTSFKPGLDVDGNERSIPVFSLCCDRSEIVFNEFDILGLSNEFKNKSFNTITTMRSWCLWFGTILFNHSKYYFTSMVNSRNPLLHIWLIVRL